jgi:ankyrin repeat protein
MPGPALPNLVFCAFAFAFACVDVLVSVKPADAQDIYNAARAGDLDGVKRAVEKSPGVINKSDSSQQYTALHWAVNYGKEPVVNYLLEKGAKLDATSNYGYTPLHLAAMGQNKKIVDALLAKKPNVNGKDNNGYTPIMFAMTHNGSKEMIQAWLDAGADLTVKNNQNQTVLHLACLYANEEVAELFVKRGIPIKETDDYGYTPLAAAASRNSVKIVKMLLDKRADVNFRSDANGMSVLHWTCQHGAIDVFRLIIDKVKDVDTKDKQNQTPLILAANAGQQEMVESLLKKGADPNTVSTTGYMCTALHGASIQGNAAMVKTLIENGATKMAADQNGDTPLHIAARGGHFQWTQPMTDDSRMQFGKIAEYLVGAGADVNRKNNEKKTPLELAIEKRNHFAVDVMIPKAEKVDIEIPGEASVLHWACRNGLKNTVALITKRSTLDVHNKDSEGQTPFFLAAASGNLEILETLLKFDPKIDQPNNNGETPLLIACWNGNSKIAQRLLQLGANINATDAGGQTALHMAAWGGHKSIVELLLENGLKANIKTETGYTPLHAAAWQGNDEVVLSLIKSGCDVDVQDNEGTTPLHKAIRAGKFETVKALILNGADPHKKDSFGLDAVAKSKSCKNPEIVAFFADR